TTDFAQRARSHRAHGIFGILRHRREGLARRRIAERAESVGNGVAHAELVVEGVLLERSHGTFLVLPDLADPANRPAQALVAERARVTPEMIEQHQGHGYS